MMMNSLIKLSLVIQLLNQYYKNREEVEKYRIEDFISGDKNIAIVTETRKGKTERIELCVGLDSEFQLAKKDGTNLLANISSKERKEYADIIENFSW